MQNGVKKNNVHQLKKHLLSIDGGGIRGIIPLCILAKLEQDSGLLSRDIFEFVAGTSTGAIITGGIVAGIPAAKMLELYLTKAHRIFKKYPWTLVKRLLFGSMYSTHELHKNVVEELGSQANMRLNDSPIDLLITSKRLEDGKPIYFVKDNLKNTCYCGGLKVVDCIVASAAAPTYFEPWLINNGAQSAHYIDGGVGIAGNPVYQACVEAFTYTPGYNPGNTIVVSLGTGRFRSTIQPKSLDTWLAWTIKELLDSPSEQQTELVARHYPEVPFYRMDPYVPDLDPSVTREIWLDEVEAMATLLKVGKQYAARIPWRDIFMGKPSPVSQYISGVSDSTISERHSPAYTPDNTSE